MDNTIYLVEWRRYYAEYGFSYITRDREKAEEVMKAQEKEHTDCDFWIEPYKLDESIPIWD